MIPIPDPDWLDRAGYPFARRMIRLRDGALHLVDDGAGAPIVFSHGTPTWSYEYRHLIAAFRGSHRVIAPDHLGFGLSERPAGADYSPEAHAARFAELLDGLDLRDVTLVVHDFGGPIALPWAAANPDRVARIVYLNTFAAPIEDLTMIRRARFAASAFGRFLYRFANASLRLIMPSAYGDRRKLTPAIHRQYLAPFVDRSARVLVLHALARALLGSAAFYRSIAVRAATLARIPSLILWGLRDSAFGPAYLDALRRALPDAETHVLDSAGHWPHEESPEKVIDLVRIHLHGCR